MDAPPSRLEWALEGELRGHTVQETLAYADWVSDYDDELARQHELPVGVVLAGDGAEPRWLGRLRRLFGR
jgi:hypothetical protein